jgi:alkanesulfonate monooxygenase SsuD/methylene tetrahydromethanopterin reductase-like flavin-dependent oxidoreductase (luciferase family)
VTVSPPGNWGGRKAEDRTQPRCEGGRTAARTKEYIEIIRSILAGKKLRYEGEFFRLDNAWIPQPYGVGVAAGDLAVPTHVSIFVGATGSMVLRVGGAYADGVIINSLATPEYIEWAKERSVRVLDSWAVTRRMSRWVAAW